MARRVVVNPRRVHDAVAGTRQRQRSQSSADVDAHRAQKEPGPTKFQATNNTTPCYLILSLRSQYHCCRNASRRPCGQRHRSQSNGDVDAHRAQKEPSRWKFSRRRRVVFFRRWLLRRGHRNQAIRHRSRRDSKQGEIVSLRRPEDAASVQEASAENAIFTFVQIPYNILE